MSEPKEDEDCPNCDGTGIWAKKDWYSPDIFCDDCNGTGVVPDELPDPVDKLGVEDGVCVRENGVRQRKGSDD